MKKFYLLFLFATLISANVSASTFPISVVVTNGSCGGPGSIIVTPLGGVGPYSYAINGLPYQASNVFNGLPPGVYTVVVVDINGDSGSETVTIVSSPMITATATVTPASCSGVPDGSITILATAGTAPFEFSLDGGTTYQSSNILSNLAAGAYTITIRDVAGCVISMTVVVPFANSATANAGNDTTICAGTSAQLHGSGGSVYSWSPAAGLSDPNIANPVATPVASTIYQLTVSSGPCTSTSQVTVVVMPLPAANAGPDASVCAGSSVQLSGSGGTTYSWSPSTGLSDPSVADPIANPAATTTYQLTVSNGVCTASDFMVLSVHTAVANAGADVTICAGGSVQLTGTGGIVYLWSPSIGLSDPLIANPIASPASTTHYILAVTDASGCIASDTITVSVQTLDVPLVTLNTGTLTVTNPDISATYTWQVLNGSSWDDIIPLASGTSYTPVTTGEYRVKAVSGPCTEFSGSMMAGRHASGNEFGIYLYPNPTTGLLVLDEMRLSQNWETLEIVNSQGMRMLVQDIKNRTSVTVNVSNFKTGIYNVKLRKADGGSTMFRFMKQ